MRKLRICVLALCLALLLSAAWAEGSFTVDAEGTIRYSGGETELTVPQEVDGVPVRQTSSSFLSGDSTVTSVIFPEGLEVLGPATLNTAEALARVTLPQSLRVIHNNCLFFCPALTEITIPAAVRYIGYSFLDGDTALQQVTFEGVCPVFADTRYALSGLPEGAVICVPDDQLEAYKAALPAAADKIQPSGANAVIVSADTSAEDFTLDAATGTVTAYLGGSAVVTIPAEIDGTAVRAIGAGLFKYNRTAALAELPEGVTDIGAEAFAQSGLVWVSLPDSVETIGEGAFRFYTGTAPQLPASLKSIGSEAFRNASLSGTLQLPEQVESIGGSAFRTTSLKEVYFPASLQTIGEYAFADPLSQKISYIYFDGLTLPEIAQTAFEGQEIDDVDLNWQATKEAMLSAQNFFDSIGQSARVWRAQNPNASVTRDRLSTYENGWMTGYTGEMTHIRPWDEFDGVTTIGIADGALKGNQVVTFFAVPHSDEFVCVGAEAFADSALETVDLFDSVTTIGAEAFRGSRLKELTLPASLEEIGSRAFADCAELETITVLCSPWIIPDDAFEGCTAVTTVRTADNDGSDSVALAEELMLRIPSLMPEPEPTPVPVPASGADYALYGGTWYLTVLREGCLAYKPADLGITGILTLNADGTADLAFEETTAGVWQVVDGVAQLTADGEAASLSLEGDTLVMTDGGTVMLFGREAPEETPFTPAEPVKAADAGAFAGNWQAIRLSYSGRTYLPVEGMEETWTTLFGSPDMRLTIDGTAVTWFGRDTEQFAFEVENGVLALRGEPIEGLDSRFLDEVLTLRADGTLSFEVIGVTIICERAASGETEIRAIAGEPQDLTVRIGVKYVADYAVSSGITMDAALLGVEYSARFLEGGTVELILAGGSMGALPCTRDGDSLVVDYYGMQLIFTDAGDGALNLNYYGSMDVHLVPEE